MPSEQRAERVDRLRRFDAMSHRDFFRRRQWIGCRGLWILRDWEMRREILLFDVRANHLPDFFRDEWHERMQQAQHLVEDVDQHPSRARLRLTASLERFLRKLDVPITELVPD